MMKSGDDVDMTFSPSLSFVLNYSGDGYVFNYYLILVLFPLKKN